MFRVASPSVQRAFDLELFALSMSPSIHIFAPSVSFLYLSVHAATKRVPLTLGICPVALRYGRAGQQASKQASELPADRLLGLTQSSPSLVLGQKSSSPG